MISNWLKQLKERFSQELLYYLLVLYLMMLTCFIRDIISDISQKEQLSLVICYINKEDGTVCERLDALRQTVLTSGQNLLTILDKNCSEMSLDWRTNLVGQSYDGAASMRDFYNGLQSHVKKENPRIIGYFTCRNPNKSTLSKTIIDTNRNPCLEYSPSKDSAYCFYCRAFPSNKSDITFISEGFRQWSKACFKSFPKHEQLVPHKESSTKIAGYNEAKQSGSIINKVNTQYNQEVAENREYLKCVLETLLFCARQGIAIRGHRENEESQNKGNFQELLNLSSRDNDIIRRYFTEKEKKLSVFVIDSLENISENDSIHESDANSLLKSMKTFEFLFCVHFFKDIMSITNILSKYLQSSNIDYSSVQHMTKATIQELSNMRCEDKFDMIWSKANVMRIDNEICSPILSRKSKVPKKLGGGLKQNENCNVKDHYKINIYFQVLDTIISDMKERFKENDIHILNCMQDIIVNEPTKFTSFQDVSTMYGFNESELKAETKIFNRMYRSLNTENTIQSKIKYMRSGDNAIGFPTLAKLYKLFLTIPSNSAACERSFSCLRRLKNYLRSTMGQSRLNHLGILQIERERSLNINNDEVIKQFDSFTIPRRLKFNNF
ncbi:hypothetical protein QTP88_018966 [Uroleucon formosanum]